MHAIEIEGVTHIYKKNLFERPKKALSGLTLRVEEGEVFGYLGANGAGKTTTIKILVGLQPPTEGSARIFGISVEDVASRRLIGFQPENPYFYEYLTAAETLSFYAALSDVPRSERQRRTGELLEFVGLTEAAQVRVKEFSKGMRQRLGIAQALIHDPKVVILDEPMSGLDPLGRRQVREAILALKAKGLTVFFSSHILSDVQAICDRAGLLVKGVLESCGPVEDLLRPEEKEIEVCLASLSEEKIAALSSQARSVRREGAQVYLIFREHDAAEAAVREALLSGGRLLGFLPIRESLEEVFMRKTGCRQSEVGAWSGGADR